MWSHWFFKGSIDQTIYLYMLNYPMKDLMGLCDTQLIHLVDGMYCIKS